MLINVSTAAEVTSFLPTLHTTLQAANLTSQVTIACCDTISWSDAKKVTAALASANQITPYLGLLTSHSTSFSNPNFPCAYILIPLLKRAAAFGMEPTTPQADFLDNRFEGYQLTVIIGIVYSGEPNSLISTTLSNLPPVWMTEGADLKSAWCTTWYSSGGACEGLTWASKIATGILSADLSAYIYWQGLEVNQPQASSYLVAVLDGATATPSGRLWAFAMWSRFIRPGAVRLGTTGTISSVQIGAFKNTDGSVVVVFTNSGSSAKSAAVSVSGFTPSAASAWLTDNSNSVNSTSATLSGGVVTVSLPSYSVVTVKLTGAAGNGKTSISSK